MVVEALNVMPGVWTVSSCQGGRGIRAHIYFRYGIEDRQAAEEFYASFSGALQQRVPAASYDLVVAGVIGATDLDQQVAHLLARAIVDIADQAPAAAARP
jgi:hypothetical protein